ncbi:MAG TPA: PecA family PE domain-processing aspartic protease [Mycobacterium sp.]|nr:PecA family PE domain-processing aspartic protease [Mycobacterium sp.]
MSFLVSPPEVISSLLYAGAGSGPMLAASAAWEGLAAELSSAAQSFSSVTSGLTEEAWQGAASTAMLSTAAQYSGVLSVAAAQAQTAAAQAQAVASEFESALAATVHPALVSVNRNQLVQLVVSNLFGQNAPAIAAAESEYEQMWAQDVSAMVGYHGGVSAAAAQLPTWAAAIKGLPGQAVAAAAGSPVGSVLNAAAASPIGAAQSTLNEAASAGALADPLGTLELYAIKAINAPTEILIGRPLIGGTSYALGGSANGTQATVPLTVVGGTEPIVNGSVGTGTPQPLLVDTGSTGLVIPFQNAGGLLGVLQLGIPRGIGIGGYSGGLDYLYLTYNAPVNFGGGVATSPTPVDIEFFAWPVSIHSAIANGFTFQSFFSSDGATGVLGVGPNAGGPGPSIATQALPAPYNQGVLINQPAGQLVFESQSSVGLPPIATLTGSPITTLDVSLDGGATKIPVSSIVDSGGVDGTLPTNLNAPVGTNISVYAPTGQLLYQYGLGTTYSPLLISSGLMNTGNLPFEQHAAYIDYGANTTTFY